MLNAAACLLVALIRGTAVEVVMKKLERRTFETERDRILIVAMYRARNTMILLHGSKVTFGTKTGFLNFETEIRRLTEALRALGIDPPCLILG
jgi:hypothetical protein